MDLYDEFLLEVHHDNELVATFKKEGGSEGKERGKIDLTPQIRRFLDYFVELLNRGALDERGLQLLGESLFEALFCKSIGSLFDEAVQWVRENGRRLRVWISVDQRSEITRWPLEFLRSRSAGWLATENQHITLSRNISFESTNRRPKRHGPPLKVLIVVSKPKDLPEVMTRAIEDISKWAAASESQSGLEVKLLGLVEEFELAPQIQYLNRPATFANVNEVNAQFKPDILHFIGHGTRESEQAALFLVDNEGNKEACAAADFQELIRNWKPSLVVLQACESAAPGKDVGYMGGFMSLAAHMVQNDIPAVVAMQFEFRNDCATEFAAALYQALAKGWEIDAAVQQGRSTISYSSSLKVRWRERHFGTPVLFMLSPEGIILPVSASGAGKTPERQVETAPPGKVSERQTDTAASVPVETDTTASLVANLKEMLKEELDKGNYGEAGKLATQLEKAKARYTGVTPNTPKQQLVQEPLIAAQDFLRVGGGGQNGQ